jgi:hypothetical protein
MLDVVCVVAHKLDGLTLSFRTAGSLHTLLITPLTINQSLKSQDEETDVLCTG